MARAPMNQLGPVPEFPERQGNTVDKVIATPRRNRLSERSGERFGEESLWAIPAVNQGLAGGAGDQHGVYDAKIAPNGRTDLAATNPPPSWDQVDQPMLSAFMVGSTGEPGRNTPPPYRMRPGANPAPSGTQRPTLGRTNTRFATVTAPISGGRGRRNVADISDC